MINDVSILVVSQSKLLSRSPAGVSKNALLLHALCNIMFVSQVSKPLKYE